MSQLPLITVTWLLCQVLLQAFASSGLTTAKAATSPNSFAKVSGQNLVLNGQPIHLKGLNFYPYQTPWSYMWSQWNGPQVQAEVGQIAILGANVVRVLVPYGDSYGWNDGKTGEVKPEYLNELRQMLQIAASYQIKVIITLFDFDSDFPAANTPQEAANLTYLHTIVNAFANDDRVLAWDLHNEPDNYPLWNKQNNSAAVLDWLARMREAVLQVDSNHLLTIGAGSYENMWQIDNQGRSIISLSDFIGWHSYNALDFGNEVVHIRERTDKPILLEETGWPTGPAGSDPNFTDAQQLKVYQLAFRTAQSLNLVGVLGWVWRDEVPIGLINLQDFQNYYGLVRHNGTLKPAALYFKNNYPVMPFLSANATQTALALTAQAADEDPRSVYFPQTDHFVSTPLKELWRRAGGEAVFGLPLTDAIVEQVGDDGTPFGPNAKIVQYFERARFEYYPDKIHEPDFLKYSHLNKYFYIIKFGTLGQALGGTTLQNNPKVERQQPDSATYTYFTDTGHDLSGSFLKFWSDHYGDKILGEPLSQPLTMPITATDAADGKAQTLEVQYFQSGRLEYHPELTGQSGEVQVSKLGLSELAHKGQINSQPADLPANAFSDPAFFGSWQHTDQLVASGSTARSWLWGPNGFATVIEPYTEAGHNGWRLVQYFDKSRMELTHPTADNGASSGKWYITNGLLVKEMISGQEQVGDSQFITHDPAQIVVAGDPTETNPDAPTYVSFANIATLKSGQNQFPNTAGQYVKATLDKSGKISQLVSDNPLAKLTQNTAYIPQTNHNIPAIFWQYLTQSQGTVLDSNGKVAQGDVIDWTFSTGLPLTEAYWVKTKVGGVELDVLVQAFERRILTYTATNPAAFQVEMGNVGRHYYQWRYQSGNYYVQVGQNQ